MESNTPATRSEVFSSRWGMLLAMLGMAVGTGNIWRFPRIAASNGGGSFLVAWVVFLLLWSVPLLILEFGMGKGTRRGAIGAFIKTIGPKFAWMGAFVAWCAVAIMFYYSVVMGWTIRFFWASLMGEIPTAVPDAFWNGFAESNTAILTHIIAMSMGLFVVSRGVKGIEKAAKILIPSLIILVVVLAVKAVTLPGAAAGLEFLFTPNLSELLNYEIWLQALTQNAWDTGAGWGLVLTYAIYMRSREDTALNAFVIGFGNNSMSLLAGIMVICTAFVAMPGVAAEVLTTSNNEGLTFIWVPQLFAELPGGRFFMILFFMALVFAAWTSLVAMIELASRILMDLGLSRGRAITLVGVAGILCGIPSAMSMEVFGNQDWVWGVGLMIAGLFFAISVLKYGVTKWRETFINTEYSDIHVGAWWDWAIRFVVVQAVVLMGWWLWSARGASFEETWTLFSSYNIGSVIIQWVIVLGLFILANRWLASRTMAGDPAADQSPDPGTFSIDP